jgi:hypothetical protein
MKYTSDSVDQRRGQLGGTDNDVLVGSGTTPDRDPRETEIGRVGFEPTLPYGKGILSPLRLPFRHRPSN